MIRTAQLLLSTVLTLGCTELERELPELLSSKPALAHVVVEDAGRGVEELGPVAKQIATRLAPPPFAAAVESLGDCAHAATMASSPPGAEVLVLANLDVRLQTRGLIPRRVTERLETGEMALLASVEDTGGNAAAKRDSPLSASSLTREDLGRIEQQRYLGVFYVTQYQGPALIIRIGKIRREWFEGTIGARFVLFDTQTRTALCGVEVHAKNDVKDAPIRSRLQAETRARLERALGDALRQQAQQATARFAPSLAWP